MSRRRCDVRVLAWWLVSRRNDGLLDALCHSSLLLRWRLWHLQLGAARKHLLESDTDALDDRQQDGASDGAVARRLVTSTDGQRATCQETGDDGIVRVLLLPHALDSAVECREEAAENTEVAAEHRRSHLDGRDGADPPLTVGRVAEALDAVPYRSANCTHAEGAAKVVQDDPGAGISRVVHGC